MLHVLFYEYNIQTTLQKLTSAIFLENRFLDEPKATAEALITLILAVTKTRSINVLEYD